MKISLKGTKTEHVNVNVDLFDAGCSVSDGLLNVYGLSRAMFEKNGKIGHDERNDFFVVDVDNPTGEQLAVLDFCHELVRWMYRADQRIRMRKS